MPKRCTACPLVDSCDWSSLLYRCEGCIDPVGVFWLDRKRDRRWSSMAESFALATRGAPAQALPSPRGELCSSRTPEGRIELKICNAA